MNDPIHADEEVMEQYCLGTLPQAECESLEEHTLTCTSCQDRLAEMECYIRAMQDAARKIRDEENPGR